MTTITDSDDGNKQCDSCAKIVPEEEATHGFAYGLEGTFCAVCRGEKRRLRQ